MLLNCPNCTIVCRVDAELTSQDSRTVHCLNCHDTLDRIFGIAVCQSVYCAITDGGLPDFLCSLLLHSQWPVTGWNIFANISDVCARG